MGKWSTAHVTTGKWSNTVSVSGSGIVTVTVSNAADTITMNSMDTAIMTSTGAGSVSGTVRHIIDGISSAFVMMPAESVYGNVEQSIGRAWQRDFEQIGSDFYRVIGAVHERERKEEGR
jgi:hypothetical protein